MKQTLNMRQHLHQFDILLFIRKSHAKYVGDPQFSHHWHKPNCLTAISSHCLAALPATLSVFNSYSTCGKRPTIVAWTASSKICWHVIVTQQRPIVEQFAPEFCNLPLQAKKRI